MIVMPRMDEDTARIHCARRHDDATTGSHADLKMFVRQFLIAGGGRHAIEVWVRVPSADFGDVAAAFLLRACYYGETPCNLH